MALVHISTLSNEALLNAYGTLIAEATTHALHKLARSKRDKRCPVTEQEVQACLTPEHKGRLEALRSELLLRMR